MTKQTIRAVERQLKALGERAYDIGVRPQDGAFIYHSWTPAETVTNIAWLRQRNAAGDHIYVRPAAPLPMSSGILLIDDLTQQSLARMKEDDTDPAATIETSPGNYQTWVRVSAESIDAEVATMAAKILAKRYGGDTNSADFRHYGRLAGFTKPGYRNKTTGLAPFVMLRTSRTPARIHTTILVDAIHALAEQDRYAESRNQIQPVTAPEAQTANGMYKGYAQAILNRFADKPWSKSPDWSRMDWMIGHDMLMNGETPAKVVESILAGSPDLETRHKGRVEKYVHHTVNKLRTLLKL